MLKYGIKAIMGENEGRCYDSAKSVIYYFAPACMDCGAVFRHRLCLWHTNEEKGAQYSFVVCGFCLLPVLDFSFDEGAYRCRIKSNWLAQRVCESKPPSFYRIGKGGGFYVRSFGCSACAGFTKESISTVAIMKRKPI